MQKITLATVALALTAALLSVAAAQGRPDFDPCAYLPQGEAQAALGAKIAKTTREGSSGGRTCAYFASLTPGRFDYLSVVVGYPAPELAGTPLRQVVAAGSAGGVKIVPLKGLGNDALLMTVPGQGPTLWARKGTRLVGLTHYREAGAALGQDALAGLARKVLARLP